MLIESGDCKFKVKKKGSHILKLTMYGTGASRKSIMSFGKIYIPEESSLLVENTT